MRIFSNFDTRLRKKTFNEYQESYGIENVLCFWRSRLYWAWKVILPLTFIILPAVLGLIFFYQRLNGNYFSYIVVAFVIICIIFFFPIVGKYIDYKMDFVIVIPDSIIMYEQWGIFKKNVITISSQSIKTISIQKAGLLYSIFDNGDIIILTEWDAEHNGESILRRVPKPEKRRNQIVKIIGIDLEADQDPKI